MELIDPHIFQRGVVQPPITVVLSLFCLFNMKIPLHPQVISSFVWASTHFSQSFVYSPLGIFRIPGLGGPSGQGTKLLLGNRPLLRRGLWLGRDGCVGGSHRMASADLRR